MNETITVKDGQAAVTTTAVSGTLSPKSSATDIITVVKTENGDQAAVKVVDLGGGGGGGGDYLPLSGGTVSGDVAVEGILKVGRSIFKEQYNILTITPWSGMPGYQLSSSYFRGTGTDQTLGGGGNFWANVYTKKLNNGADITIPTLGGTLARIEDLQNETTTLNAAIAGKQDKLTAGENITIEDGVISATGGGSGGSYLPLSGGTITGEVNIEKATDDGSQALRLMTGTGGLGFRSYYLETLAYNGSFYSVDARYQFTGSGFAALLGNKALGEQYNPWSNFYLSGDIIFVDRSYNTHTISLPATTGTMVVATPPAEDGTYVLKCVITDGVPTVSWVKE